MYRDTLSSLAKEEIFGDNSREKYQMADIF